MNTKSIIRNKFSTIKLQNYRVFTGILFGFLLFGLKDFAALISPPLQRIVALFGLLFIFGTPFLFKYKVIIPLKGKIRILFYIFLGWVALIILRPMLSGDAYSHNSIHPYADYGLTSYLLPLVVLLGTRLISLQKLFKINYIFAIIGFVFFVLNFNNMQTILSAGILNNNDEEMPIYALASKYYFWFSISSLSLLCYEFLITKQRWFAILSSVFLLFLMIYFARRGGVFMSLLYFFGAFFLYIKQNSKVKKIYKYLFVLAIISFGVVTVYMNSDSTFSLIFSRLNEDTRSDVDNVLIRDLSTHNAWIFGKGIEGTYIHSGFDLPRYTHETGYLYLILKGGVIYLLLYCLLLLHSVYVGFFRTNNRLTKALSLYIFFHLVFLFPFGLQSFSLEYLFVWISFALCESIKWRSMTNQQVKFHIAKSK